MARLPGRTADAMAAGLHGELWIGDASGLTRRSADGLRVLGKVALPPGFSPIGKIHALAQGADGSVWMSAVGGGAWRYRNGKWERPAMLPRQGEKTPLSMLADNRGRVWFGYIDNEVVLLDGERTRSFGKEQGLEIGKVALLTEYEGSVLAGGADGLARFDGTRFRPVAARPAQALRGLSGAAAGAGALWLNGAAGVVRLDAGALSGAGMDDAGPARIFDERDGLRDRTGILDVGTMARAADGRIWMSTAAGVSWLDPAAVASDPAPYKTSLLRTTVDGKVHDAGPSLVLPPAPGRMSFAFASPALSMPERVRYRYRLEGYDRDWQQAGAATEATYTGLPPGSYRFVAQAVNGDGVAGPQSDPLSVQVTPSLTQTGWFRAACALLAAALLWALYRYRLHVQARRLLAIERTRQAERERIARELHDTLLQGVQGLIFIFDAAAQSAVQEPLRTRLDAALGRARGMVAEARDRVHGLRAGDRHPVDLGAMLAGLAARVGAEYRREIAFTAVGEPPHVEADLADTCCRIAEEALRNACRHGAASHVSMELGHAGHLLTLAVRDDGIGIDSEVARAGKPGHWGLAGMHERALLAGGRLDIVTGTGEGTALRLELPLTAPQRRECEAAGGAWP
ncbi:histidine kinase [Massilia sp. IC2-278]|uniref:sensor histidine kinase n=1 Tax=Massilia sp. IC2-278 TaxID=2887200 RepID=UPI001E445C6D|nr:sensor histidine kinase [Massilia sp. IC2-278]MCC2963652.1 histidine kinase [Massilia sp. IC2-278]